MSDEPTVRCPSCDGRRRINVHVAYADRPHARELTDCPICSGTGRITTDFADRLAGARARLDDRINRGVSLRDEAKRLGITPAELSDIEHGRQA